MKFTSRKRRQPPAVIIVALIDVLIVVLIFLMVTTSFKHRQPAIKLALPVSDQAEPGASEKNPLAVTITTNAPHFYLSDLPVTLERLRAELTARAQQNPDLHVAVRAHKKAEFEKIVNVWDAARAAKIKNLEVFTQQAETSR